MTTLLDRPTPYDAPLQPPPSRVVGWWGRWRVALRLARRDAWRGKARALLVVLLIALPVATATGVLVYSASAKEVTGGRHQALLSLGRLADARVILATPPVNQAVTLWQSTDGAGAADSGRPQRPAPLAAVAAAMPSGSRVVGTGTTNSVVIESGPWGVQGAVSLQDLADPLVAARWTVLEGRLPAAPTEVALGVDDLRRLQTAIGSTVTVTTTLGDQRAVPLTVVGSVLPYAPGMAGDAVALPGALPSDGTSGTGTGEVLVQSPQPWTWSDVRRVNEAGGLVLARGVLESPPSFCDLDTICLDSGPDPGVVVDAPSPVAAAEAARVAALLAVALVLVVLQVALLAGPAFAVQLRRRQRELGLLGASGADAATLRRTVLASGIVLGAVGGALGVLVGWGAVGLLGGALPWAPLASSGTALGRPAIPPYIFGVVAIGVISATCAALVPAVIAGRGEVLDTLRGRRPLPALRTRTPVLGLLCGLAGIGLLLYGRAVLDPLVLGSGIVVAELGLVLVMPWLVVRVSALGRLLPLTPRLALRDAGRHRLRTAMAACAIAAAAAAAVATSTWQTSQALQFDVSGTPYVAGSLAVSASSADLDAPVLVDRLRGAVGTVAPGSVSVPLVNLAPRSSSPGAAESGAPGVLACVTPQGADIPTGVDDYGALEACGSTTSTSPDGRSTFSATDFGLSNGSGAALLPDPDQLGSLLGPLVDVSAAVATLKAGGVVVTVPGALDTRGRVWLRPEPETLGSDGSLNQSFERPIALPAVEASGGATPAAVLVGPAALEAGRPLAAAARTLPWVVLVVTPSVADRPDRPTVADQLSLALAKARIPASVYDMASLVDHGPDTVGLVLVAASVGTLLMALLAGLMVTALALADARSDLVTLAAVGAAPRVRRRMAAASAGTVSALGCTAGVAAGLLLAWLLVGLFYAAGGRAFEVRWWLVAFVLVAIPVITSAVAWVTTRSRVGIPRRSDS